ncbi:MAG: aminotransferase class I/II-fold pyridoxal phosphate-dependent enzyme [Planctomycetales bacterium]|nr:aminotransferase class I/II-fold pyridoxal phosphate-dependent enzyme [Planctomycetales bacterium]
MSHDFWLRQNSNELSTSTGVQIMEDQTLAVLGGVPAFTQPLHVGRPNIANAQGILRRIADAVERHWLTNDGMFVQSFEQAICRRTGVGHCVATSSGTAGLQLAAAALGMQGEVIMPAMTFVATPHAISWAGGRPRFVDIGWGSWTLDLDAVQTAITSKTGGIVGVHLFGRPCEVAQLDEVAREHRIPLLFDAAHAFDCSQNGLPIGHFGDAEVFSFHATKFINCAEGGAVVTNDERLADRLRAIRNFGFCPDGRVRYRGLNAKMSELQAAVGLSSLENIEPIVATNRANFARYDAVFRSLPGLRLFDSPADATSNRQYVVVEVNSAQFGLSRDELMEVLHAENVLVRRYFYPPCHRLDAYAGADDRRETLPVTDHVSARVLAFPTGLAVDAATIDRIGQIVQTAAKVSEQIRDVLTRRQPEDSPTRTHRMDDEQTTHEPHVPLRPRRISRLHGRRRTG